MTLSDADAVALDGGANLALVGDELIQFASARPLGVGRWRLGRLLRGRRGTEWASGGQAAGARFVLIEPDALATVALPAAAIGTEVRVLASGIGDVEGPAAATLVAVGASVRPPGPVALRWTSEPDGGATVHWVRRSRVGWRWGDGGDVPLSEEVERYRVTVGARTLVVDTPAVVVSAVERAAGPVAVAVRQLGTHAPSVAAEITIV